MIYFHIRMNKQHPLHTCWLQRSSETHWKRIEHASFAYNQGILKNYTQRYASFGTGSSEKNVHTTNACAHYVLTYVI